VIRANVYGILLTTSQSASSLGNYCVAEEDQISPIVIYIRPAYSNIDTLQIMWELRTASALPRSALWSEGLSQFRIPSSVPTMERQGHHVRLGFYWR